MITPLSSTGYHADLLIDAKGTDIRRRTGVTAPDAFVYLRESNGEETVYFDAREYDVQKQRLDVLGSTIRLERLEPHRDAARALGGPLPIPYRTLLQILRSKRITGANVSPDLGYGWVKTLLDAGIAVELHDFSAEGRTKTERQLALMIDAQRVTEGAYALARAMLAESTIEGDRLLYRNDLLTSERMKSQLKTYFLERGYANDDGMIVASADQTARPHDDGSGPIRPHEFIIIDIFPRNDATGYCADMTRTFVKGNATSEMRRLYEAVRDVQEEILDFADIGVRSDAIYDATVEAFKVRGYPTSPERGFMHRTGHGLGMSVHEEPSLLTGFPDALAPGMAVTVEPGLYFPDLGGARIEDVLIFHDDARKENISHFAKDDWIIS